jgi:hypothetical protein
MIGYTGVPKADGKQALDLQCDALIAAGVDAKQIFVPISLVMTASPICGKGGGTDTIGDGYGERSSRGSWKERRRSQSKPSTAS